MDKRQGNNIRRKTYDRKSGHTARNANRMRDDAARNRRMDAKVNMRRETIKSSPSPGSVNQYKKSAKKSKPAVYTKKTKKRSSINDSRNKEILNNNNFIGVEASYVKKRPERTYNDGYDGFVNEYKAIGSRRRIQSPTKRKLKRRLMFALLIIFVLAIGVILSCTVFFKTEKISVILPDGDKVNYTSQDIINVSGLEIGSNLFVSDKASAKKHITDTYSYIKDVQINIKLPDTLEISITAAKDEYTINSDKDYFIVGDNEKILEKTKKAPANIPVLSGIELTSLEVGSVVTFKNKSIQSILNKVIELAKLHKLSPVTQIDMTILSDINITYDNRIKIIIGTNDDLEYKMKTAAIIIYEKLSSDDRGTLDVSLCHEGNRQSSFLPDNMVSSDIIVPQTVDSDKSSDNDSLDTQDSQDGDNTQNYEDANDNYDNYDDSYDSIDYDNNDYEDYGDYDNNEYYDNNVFYDNYETYDNYDINDQEQEQNNDG